MSIPGCDSTKEIQTNWKEIRECSKPGLMGLPYTKAEGADFVTWLSNGLGHERLKLFGKYEVEMVGRALLLCIAGNTKLN